MRSRWFGILVFLGFFLSYAALSPGTVGGVGYLPEELQSGQSILDRLGAAMTGQPLPPFVPSRHGALPVLLHLPFIVAGRAIVTPDFALSFEAVLFTALISTVMFLWVERLAGLLPALTTATIAAFTTMLWPYAYIGLETTQSLFVLLTGYLTLGTERRLTWRSAIALGFCAAIAVSAKSTSIVLLPAVAYCLWIRIRRDSPVPLHHGLAVAALMALTLGASSLSRSLFWGAGGAAATLRVWVIPDLFHYPLHLVGYLGSPNKGLLVYCPVVLIAFLLLPLTWTLRRQLVIFALLVFAGLACSFSLLLGWSDEVWGPRYVHSAVAPFIVCMGAVWPRLSARWKTFTAALSAFGLIVSTLGALFYYGLLHQASMAAGQNTLENLQGDITWNHVRFNARLFWFWLHPVDSAHWQPVQRWLYTPPAGAPTVPVIDLRTYSRPQSPLLRDRSLPKSGTYQRITLFYLLCLFSGPAILLYCWVATLRGWRTAVAPAADPPGLGSLPEPARRARSRSTRQKRSV